jgi:non-specific serine/threonine protein kinase
VTLQKIEAEERRPSNEIAGRLAEALELPPEERTTFIKVARAELGVHRLAPASGASARLPAARLRQNHLPVPLTPLIGRAHEVAALNLLLQRDDVRLLTLTGVGGTGKTRLAMEVAGGLQHDFADGITFVELAPLSDPDLVATTIAQALVVQEAPGQPLLAQIKAYLRDKQHLLVLDNFEHLLAAAPLVTDLLRAAPRLTVLVTSRAVLRLSGEHEYPVLPLNVPAERGRAPLRHTCAGRQG